MYGFFFNFKEGDGPKALKSPEYIFQPLPDLPQTYTKLQIDGTRLYLRLQLYFITTVIIQHS